MKRTSGSLSFKTFDYSSSTFLTISSLCSSARNRSCYKLSQYITRAGPNLPMETSSNVVSFRTLGGGDLRDSAALSSQAYEAPEWQPPLLVSPHNHRDSVNRLDRAVTAPPGGGVLAELHGTAAPPPSPSQGGAARAEGTGGDATTSRPRHLYTRSLSRFINPMAHQHAGGLATPPGHESSTLEDPTTSSERDPHSHGSAESQSIDPRRYLPAGETQAPRPDESHHYHHLQTPPPATSRGGDGGGGGGGDMGAGEGAEVVSPKSAALELRAKDQEIARLAAKLLAVEKWMETQMTSMEDFQWKSPHGRKNSSPWKDFEYSWSVLEAFKSASHSSEHPGEMPGVFGRKLPVGASLGSAGETCEGTATTATTITANYTPEIPFFIKDDPPVQELIFSQTEMAGNTPSVCSERASSTRPTTGSSISLSVQDQNGSLESLATWLADEQTRSLDQTVHVQTKEVRKPSFEDQNRCIHTHNQEPVSQANAELTKYRNQVLLLRKQVADQVVLIGSQASQLANQAMQTEELQAKLEEQTARLAERKEMIDRLEARLDTANQSHPMGTKDVLDEMNLVQIQHLLKENAVLKSGESKSRIAIESLQHRLTFVEYEYEHTVERLGERIVQLESKVSQGSVLRASIAPRPHMLALKAFLAWKTQTHSQPDGPVMADLSDSVKSLLNQVSTLRRNESTLVAENKKLKREVASYRYEGPASISKQPFAFQSKSSPSFSHLGLGLGLNGKSNFMRANSNNRGLLSKARDVIEFSKPSPFHKSPSSVDYESSSEESSDTMCYEN